MPRERLEAAMGVPGATIASFDAWAGDYDHSQLQPTLYVPVHHGTLRLARRLVPSPGRVLDVGCGTGRLLRQARQQYPHAALVGVDPSRQMLAAARTRTPADLAVGYVHATAEHLPFARDAFDLVVATMSLRHWADPDAGIAQVAQVLTPTGVLVVADVFPTQRRRSRVVTAASPRRARGARPDAGRLRLGGGRPGPDPLVRAARRPGRRSAEGTLRGQGGAAPTPPPGAGTPLKGVAERGGGPTRTTAPHSCAATPEPWYAPRSAALATAEGEAAWPASRAAERLGGRLGATALAATEPSPPRSSRQPASSG
jgi:SAM-dependent methyltransferase